MSAKDAKVRGGIRTAEGGAEAGGKYEGFALGDGSAIFDDSLLLIEPEMARL